MNIDFNSITRENIEKQIEEYFSKNSNINISEIFKKFNISGLEIINKNNLKRIFWIIFYLICKKENDINKEEIWKLSNILVEIQKRMILYNKPHNVLDIIKSLDNENKAAWKIILTISNNIEKIKNNIDNIGKPAQCA